MGIGSFSERAQLDTRSIAFARLDSIIAYGLVTQPINIFSVDSQRKWLKTPGSAYLSTIIRTLEYICLRLAGGQ